MKHAKVMLTLVLSTALLAGCANKSEPIHNVMESIAASHTKQEMQKAIVIAGSQQGWIMSSPEPGLVTGMRSTDKYSAQIKVTYSENYFTIHYVNSTNLDARDGFIHKMYNRWISDLDQDIKVQLSIQDQQ
ncbi:hypothetical protein [Rouxiella sp. Mn2063]|uniref:hypothetical protein n=1 Tax=Rouxiella sp. Mn2063 TaxID=3395262 RepID=UPI003BD2B1AE